MSRRPDDDPHIRFRRRMADGVLPHTTAPGVLGVGVNGVSEYTPTNMHSPDSWAAANGFQIGRVPRRRHGTRRIYRTRRPIKVGPYLPMPGAPDPALMFAPNPWASRCNDPPEPGRIRMLSDPESTENPHLQTWWWQDRTLTEWIDDIDRIRTDLSGNALARAIYPLNYSEDVAALFHANQRRRWLARVVIQRLRQRVWARRPACNVDLIDLQPIAAADAILITDTTNKRIFRFHRRDLLNTVMSNLTLSDEFMPTPRHPTNPWTNEPFTRAQTMAVCHRLCADFVQRGRCPPPLLSAFWAANFSIKRFLTENSAVLSQHAIRNFFREISDDNFTTLYDTMTGLLSDAGVDFSPARIRRWLHTTPETPTHRLWLSMCRDYTLYLNLHIQVRSHWFAPEQIYRDVRALFANTQLPEITPSTRLRVIRGQTAPPPAPATVAIPTLPISLPDPMETTGIQGLLGLMLQPPTLPAAQIRITPFDVSGGDMTLDLALQLIQDSLFRL